MRSIIYKTMLVALISAAGIIQAKADVFDDLAGAIRSGNAKEVAKYFNTSVELSIQDSEGVYSRSQAEMILRDFFTKNTPQKFSIVHRGSSAGGSHYAIGNYVSSGGTYRTSIFVKEVGGQMLIHEIKFEKE